jgi:nucleotide-binding universal stress UspA family protein
MFDNGVAGVLTGILDDQTDRDVIALAQELVSPQGKLTLLHLHLVTARPVRDSGSFADTAKCRQALQRLAALADELSVDAELRCAEAHSPRRGLHELASRRGADLLVVGASRGDENDRTFIGDDTRKVLGDAPCAVAVAPPEFAARAGAIKKIGVGFDGSAQSEQAVALARRLAAERRAERSAFEAVPVPVYAGDAWNVKSEVEEHVEAERQRVAALGHLEPEAGFGDPFHELARYGQSVDLLVIGGHDYRPTDHLLEQRGYLSISGCLGHAASRPRGSVATAPSRCMRGLLAALRTRRGVPLLPSAATGARSRERAEPALRRYPLSEQSMAQRLADEVSTPLLVLPAAEAS